MAFPFDPLGVSGRESNSLQPTGTGTGTYYTRTQGHERAGELESWKDESVPFNLLGWSRERTVKEEEVKKE